MNLRYYTNKLLENWLTMSICEQLGNVGSEVSEAIKWINEGNKDLMRNSMNRAFELLNLTINDPRWQNYRQKELKITREVLMDTFYGNNQYKDTPEALEKYFYQYAVAARKDI